MTNRNVRTKLAVLHHHGDDLVEMEETYRERDEVPLDEAAIVIYLCPRCETIVTVGAITTEVETPDQPEAAWCPLVAAAPSIRRLTQPCALA